MSNVINSYRFGGGGAGYDFGNALDWTSTAADKRVQNTAPTNTTWTYSTWFYVYNNGVMILAGDSLVDTKFILTLSATSIGVRSGVDGVFTVPSMATSTWLHLMATSDGSGNGKVYLNGVESSSGTQSIGTASFKMNLVGQRRTYNVSSAFKGRIDESILKQSYVGTLTDAQNLYNSGNGVASDSVLTSPTWYLKLNESGTDTTAVDSGSGGLDGTLTGFPASGMWISH